MSSRDNFKQAAKELFGLDNGKKDNRTPLSGFAHEVDSAPQQPPQSEDVPVHPVEAWAESPHDAAPAPQTGFFADTHTSALSELPQSAPTALSPEGDLHPVENLGSYALVDSHRETSVIAKGTTIVGRIRTDGHIEVMGKVEGNVDAEGNVAVSGRVSGNVRGQHLELVSAQIKGNLNAVAGAFVSSDTVVIGDVEAETVIFDGRIKGNVTATQSAEFNRNSYLVGDITTKSISIEPGAIINGMIRTTGMDDFTGDEFDDFQF